MDEVHLVLSIKNSDKKIIVNTKNYYFLEIFQPDEMIIWRQDFYLTKREMRLLC